MTEDATERVYFDAPASAATDNSWWDRYAAELTALTPAARGALQTDCAYILNRGIFGAGKPDAGEWPDDRTRTGLVMGSVQSGKTASMFGVTALALDHGVNIVVILAGTRLSLWRQTYERLVEQLDAGADSTAKITRRLLCPAPGVALSGAPASLQDTYRLSSAQVRRKLAQERPLIVVAMKQANHLYALGNMLRGSVFDAVRKLGRPVHMLVLDDEADDGSVLDAAVEAGQDPLSPNLKQIPRAIADLWEPRSGNAPDNLYTTYVGYTATPQANLIQEDHNPLAPRDFVISLRTPLDVGHPVDPDRSDAPRSSTYPEPAGIDYYYTGGEVYYDRGTSAQLCVELAGRAEDDLGEAVRAFLVAGAIRLHRVVGASGPYSLAGADFETRGAALSASPEPHSMLFHPSADIGRHFTGAEDILLWAGVGDRATARELLESGDARLPASLISRMLSEQPLWEAWVDRYRHSSIEIATEFNILSPRTIPDWPVVRQILETEIIPGTRVSVVNSDPSADDRPEYKPSFDESTGRWRAARDLSTIFVSGNVMARGLTLEGMTTALFQRGSNNPFADTQMQMQRWFGYRGKHIELCRVFAARQQIDLFSAYHDIDEALREGIAAKMTGDAPSPVVLHGMGFLATGKIANLGRTPLCPSSRPFVTLINDGQAPDPNAKLVADLFASVPSSDVTVGRTTRGRALDAVLSLTEAADLLDQFVFDSYRPGRDNRLGELWAQIQARVSATLPLPSGTRLYNAPGPLEGEPSPVRLNCPYAIPAYLRLWDACLTRAVRGLFVTGMPSDRWSMADLGNKQRHQPRFSVGIRYGAGDPIRHDPLAELGFNIPATTKRVGIDGELDTTWGANDPSAGPLDYRGDEFFDYYHRGERVPLLSGSAPWRPAGSYGQILFYVNQQPDRPHPAVAVGVCIPAGGPEQFAATRAGSLVAV
ncbi:Z1 domain-containing protein [Arthrobacter sp. I2-34]|uniref:Z1 domain-containing protein n=1 Tax=Arthrobacter hankyongi TaxID=2904801 RepID=A0ABS9L7G2_9MICC|nr:Z1 domain-containing protein [Arthrobacter hankyongi]MCG2622621.1 Z1 domain-containing protein [Arthrobacter hankyongi]